MAKDLYITDSITSALVKQFFWIGNDWVPQLLSYKWDMKIIRWATLSVKNEAWYDRMKMIRFRNSEL
jgi:hypothetical protein